MGKGDCWEECCGACLGACCIALCETFCGNLCDAMGQGKLWPWIVIFGIGVATALLIIFI